MNRRKHLVPVFVSTLLTSVLLISCIGIESTVKFNRDGTGILFLEYRVSRELTDLGGLEGDVPFPLTEEDFRFALGETEGLKLRKYAEKMDDEDVVIRVEIGFDSIETLSALESFRNMPMSLARQNGEFVFQQTIAEPRIQEEQIGPSPGIDGPAIPDEELLAPLFEGYEMSFTVQAPVRITYHSLGELSKNQKSVTYAIPLLELNAQSEALIFTVKWED